MATLEERVTALEGDYTVVVQSISLRLDEHLAVQKGLSLEIHAQSEEMNQLKMRVATVESRLNHMDVKLGSLDENVKSLRGDMDRRFEQVDRRFEQVDRRFEQVDRRFDQMDQKIDQMGQKIDQVIALLAQRGEGNAQ